MNTLIVSLIVLLSFFFNAAAPLTNDAAQADTQNKDIQPSVQGWYNAEAAAGGVVIKRDGTVIQLPSYQELHDGCNPPKSEVSQAYTDFFMQDFCRNAMMVNTDTWPKIILHEGVRYVCFSTDTLMQASDIPYPGIAENIVYVDISEKEILDPQPGTIYVCRGPS